MDIFFIPDHIFSSQKSHDLFIISVIFRTAQHQPFAVLGAEHIVERIRNFFSVLRILIAILRRNQTCAQGIYCGMMQTDSNLIALAALLTGIQRSTNTRSQCQRHLEISKTVSRDHRRIATVYCGSKHTASCHVTGYVKACCIFLWAFLTVAKYLCKNQFGEFLFQSIIVQTQLCQRFGSGVGQEYVCFRQQFIGNLKTLRIFQIQSDKLFIHIGYIKRQILVVGKRHIKYGALRSGRIAFG